ncbi:aminotransferase class I/II-fold pyridoxal phosphate-dependent enzyme [soil metagenome]
MNPSNNASVPLPELGASRPLCPPIYQSSVYSIPDLDALDQISNAEQPGFIYARDSHPNARHLADKLSALEGGRWGIVCGSGMAAITAAFVGTVQKGDRVLASSNLYGRTTQLLTNELSRFGVETTFVDTRDLQAVKSALQTPAKLMWLETISNPLLAVPDLPALVEIAHAHNCLVAVDNTFATPTLFKPLTIGVDLVMESLTKMIGGHSDITLGFLGGTVDLFTQLSSTASIWGLSANPFDCWLALRGLATLDLRMHAATSNAAALADWLSAKTGVEKVIYPGRQDHPDHATAQRLLTAGCGNMIAVELRGGRDGVNRFMRQAPGIPFSPSLGDTTTTLSYPGSTSHRFVSPAEKKRQGISDGLIRLSVGIEPIAEIQAEFQRGLR